MAVLTDSDNRERSGSYHVKDRYRKELGRAM